MKRKPIRINWDELEEAFDNTNQELVYYLDLVDGRVLLEGEGEESDYDQDDEEYDLSPAPPQSSADDGTRARIEPLRTETKIEWIRRFLGETDDLEPELAAKLEAALEGDDPAQKIIAALRESPEGKDHWYRYRADRLHDLIDEWLEQTSISTPDSPPWV